MIPAPVLDFGAALPLLLVAVAALGVLVGEIVLSGRRRMLGRRITRDFVGSALAMLSAFFLLIVVILAVQNLVVGSSRVFNLGFPLMRLDGLANFAIAIVGLGSLLSCLLSIHYLGELDINHGEYYALLLLATSGMILLVAATDLIAVFLGIEIMSIPLYVLAGFDRRRQRSNEAALKYFLIGSFASAILLYGMALLYGATGATSFAGIRLGFDAESPLALAGLGLLLVGFAFKISSVPFHQWTPDVYEGAPVSVTAFMSVTVKSAAFVALLRILLEAFQPAAEDLSTVFWWLAAGSMVLGNVMAVIQDGLKRLLAYSSIAHAGTLMMGFVAAQSAAWSAMLFYLLAYLFMNLGAFGVIVSLARNGQELERVDDLAGLAHTRPVLAAALALFAVSLAGIPFTAGFIAKYQLFWATVQAGYVGLVVLAVLTSVVSFYYYLRLVVVMTMREGPEHPAVPLRSGEWLAISICAVGVVALGLLPNGSDAGWLAWIPPALDWSRESVSGVLAVAR